MVASSQGSTEAMLGEGDGWRRGELECGGAKKESSSKVRVVDVFSRAWRGIAPASKQAK